MTERLSLSLSWWLKPTSYKQERRIQKGFYAQEPQRVLLSFISTAEICKHHELELFFSGESDVFISIPLIGLLVPLEELTNKQMKLEVLGLCSLRDLLGPHHLQKQEAGLSNDFKLLVETM